MIGLPKIVLDRLMAKCAPQSAGVPPGPMSEPGGAHPDANLVAAFVEEALPERERTQVLTHLAQCANCREIMVLALPAEVAIAEPAHSPARRGWSAWPALRWGVLAAALGAVAIVAVLRPSPFRRRPAISKDMRPTLQAARRAAPPPPTESPSAQPGPKAALAKGGAVQPGNQNLIVARSETEQRTYPLRTAAPLPMTPGIASAPPVGTGEGDSRSEGTNSVGGTQFKSARPQPRLEPSAAPEIAKEQISNEPRALQAVALAKTEAVATEKEVRAPVADGISTPTAAPAPQQAMDARAVPHAPGLRAMAARRKLRSPAASLTPLWNVSPKGQVQRFDGAENAWKEVQVDDDVTFRAIAASDREVWAGGSSGALYHSADGGANWKRIGLTSGANTITETIVAIQLLDPQHLTVSTASRQQWATEDGGQHWQGQP